MTFSPARERNPWDKNSKLQKSRLTLSISAAIGDRFVRWKEPVSANSPYWYLQTAVYQYRRNDTSICLLAMVHFASKEYFDFYNSLNDTVVFELLVDEQLLTSNIVRGDPVLKGVGSPVGASDADLLMGRSYDLSCQTSIVDYTRPNFVHGDWTRQELLKTIEDRQPSPIQTPWLPILGRPLWQGASKYSVGKEAAAALLIGSPQLLAGRNQRPSRAFPFHRVVHKRAVQVLRPLLWLTVPSPEVSVLLLDWSASNELTLGSPVSRAVLLSLVTGYWKAVRQFAFGQVLVSSKADSGGLDWIELRNQRAIEVLKRVLSSRGSGASSPQTVSVLFGCMHCNDLHQRILEMGFDHVDTNWRDAWVVQVPPVRATRLPDAKVLRILVVFVGYLGIGGLDWIETWGDVTNDLVKVTGSADQMTELLPSGILVKYLAYLVRHLLLYMGLSQFVWTPKT